MAEGKYIDRVELIKLEDLSDEERLYYTDAERHSNAFLTELGKEAVRPYVTDVEGPVYAFTQKTPPLLAAGTMARLSRRGDDARVIFADEFLTHLNPEDISETDAKEHIEYIIEAIEETVIRIEDEERFGDGFLTDSDHDLVQIYKDSIKFLEKPDDQDEVDGEEKARDLLDRVINSFGDDSVKQLTFGSVMFEDASNLLTKKLEHGRLQAYLEQSTRYIYFDKKNPDGEYKYHTPEHFDDDTKEHYKNVTDQIFDNYSQMVKGIRQYLVETSDVPEEERDASWRNAIRAEACDAARYILPASTAATVGIVGSAHGIENMIINLQAGESREEQNAGKAIETEVQKVIPAFFDKTSAPTKGGATIAYLAENRARMRELGLDYVSDVYEKESAGATLVEVSHKNDVDAVLPHILYPVAGGQSLDEVTKIVEQLPQEEKVRIFNDYIGERMNRRHRPGRAFESVFYTWDVVCDYGIFRDLQRHRMVNNFEWQILTPFHGYETPELVNEAGFEELGHETFKLSDQLYEDLLTKHGVGGVEAQYATLFGHNMRWKWTINARQAFHLNELRTTPQGHPGYRKLVGEMHEELRKKHPNIAGAMKFVNLDENEELTRLAAEKAIQYKADVLGIENIDHDEY